VDHKRFDNLPGAVPIFFSEDPATTIRELNGNPQEAFNYYQTLQARLLDTEPITKEQAPEFLANPTLGKTQTPLVRTWESMASSVNTETPKKPSKPDKGNKKAIRHYTHFSISTDL